MRIAQCIRPLKIHLLGSKASVAIGEGWQGDLDEVIGVDGKGVPMTIAHFLGHNLIPENFRLEAHKGTRGSIAAEPQSQE